jgi:UTP--glucose-1-phosphate uridylyltransferase
MFSGNATPVINAAHLLNDEPFLYLYADDFFRSAVPRSVSLVETYQQTGKTTIALTPMDRSQSAKYGVADIKQEVNAGTFRLSGLVEKPEPDKAPHKDGQIFASTSGMVLSPDIIPVLQTQKPDPRNGELWVAWAVHALASQDEVYGRVIDGTWHDAGNKEKYLEAIVDVALADEGIAPAFKAYLQDKLAS